MYEYKSKLWLSLGVCTFLGAQTLSMADQAEASSVSAASSLKLDDGGEGGESGGEEVLSADSQNYMAGLLMLHRWNLP